MHENPFRSYYARQAGGGTAYFSGMRMQKGHGWFTKFLSNSVLPVLKEQGTSALKSLGKTALTTGVNIGSDIISGTRPSDAIKGRLEEGGGELMNKVIGRVRRAAQSGSGRKRKRTTQAGTGRKRKLIGRGRKSKQSGTGRKRKSAKRAKHNKYSFLT